MIINFYDKLHQIVNFIVIMIINFYDNLHQIVNFIVEVI